jgi:outer membrane lipoprotein SlyB
MNTPLKHLFVAASLACMVAGGGVASTAQARDYYERGYRDDVCNRCGTVRSIERVGRRDGSGGAIVGALIGGALGNQVGDGSGRRAATVAGAIAGGVAGHNMQRNRDGYRIRVRMDDGRIREFYQGRRNGLRPGDRVEVNRGDVFPLY